MVSKLKIKIGRIEFEYEGETPFTQDDIKDLFSHLEALAPPDVDPANQPSLASPEQTTPTQHKDVHTSTIASRMSAKTAAQLALAAAVHLQIVMKQKSFTRQELLTEMRGATSYFKKSFASNLSSTLTTLVSQKSFNQLSNDSYALTGPKLTELEAVVAQEE